MTRRQWAAEYTVLACLLVLAAQTVALLTLTQREDAGRPHQAPIVVTAPAVVAQSLADQADAMPDEPFDASWTEDVDEARAAVRDGAAVAAVLVDLRTTHDVVLVNARNDRDLNRAVADRLTSIGTARERTTEVQEIAPSADDDPAGRVRVFVLLCGLFGFGAVVAISLVRGPFARTAGLGVLRIGGLGVVSLGAASVLQLLPATALGGNDPAVIALGAGYGLTLGVITLAVEALAGLVGLAAVAATYFVLATPLLSGTSPYLLPPPWATLSPWSPTGAMQAAVADVAYFDPGRSTRSILLVAAWALLAVVVLLLARQFRRRAGEDPVEPKPAMPLRHWRLRVLGAVLPLAAVVALTIAVLPAPGVVAAERLPSLASETTCVDPGRIPRDVAEINHEIATLQGSPAFQGADVGADVRLQDGRFALVFGDTLRGESFDGPRFVRNSMMLWDEDCVSVVLPHNKGALIPDRLDGVGYWPMSVGVAHQPGYDLVLVSAQRVKTTGGGSFGFDNLGPALAVFVVHEGGTPQLIATEDVGPDSADKSRPEWGAALTVDAGWLYLYGTANPEEPGVFGFSLQVARVRPDDVLEASQWRYWDGATWQTDPDRAAELIPAVGGVSQTLSVFHRGDRWYALSKQDGDLGAELVFWTAPGPTGPFTVTAPVATAPSDPGSGAVRYMPLAHPSMFPEAGSVVASYSRNNTDFAKVLADPTLYRPRFLRLPLPD
ncbi:MULTISPECIES: DUF4185 domain-containing protein [unclassified Nocardioides]|uniref:DUF4185 domain-containing protein n=1 Tax=unclassified Nocardioides TaxID=2615069 RepID=UPI0010542078|nr:MULTISPECIES: DUF4185 domain-containing protein [unclassified Nocardioides]